MNQQSPTSIMNRPLKLVLVEDEPISTAYLKKQLQLTEIPFEIVEELDSVSDSILFFSDPPEVDVIFMDIQLGDGTCFDLLGEIHLKTPIIFCTTYDNYAVKAFKFNSVDYLLKPTNNEEVKVALTKFLEIRQVDEDSYLARIDTMMKSLKEPQYKKRFLIRKNSHQEIVDITNVISFYSEEGQSYLVNRGGELFAIDFTLERLEDLIDPNVFFRINRKAMISIDAIRSVEDYFNSRLRIFLIRNMEFDLLVSRNRVREFKSWLEGLG